MNLIVRPIEALGSRILGAIEEIGLYLKVCAMGILQIFAQLGMIFDDAVMNNSYRIRNMWMRVVFTRLAMGCPPRMRDPGRACRVDIVACVTEFSDLAETPDPI